MMMQGEGKIGCVLDQKMSFKNFFRIESTDTTANPFK